MKIAIIGAGCSGLTAIKTLAAAGLTDLVCFEKNARIGGYRPGHEVSAGKVGREMALRGKGADQLRRSLRSLELFPGALEEAAAGRETVGEEFQKRLGRFRELPV